MHNRGSLRCVAYRTFALAYHEMNQNKKPKPIHWRINTLIIGTLQEEPIRNAGTGANSQGMAS